jgi:gas vesicle protein
MNKKTMKGKEVRKQIKYRVNEGMDVIKEETKEINRLIKDRINEEVDNFKEETSEVAGNVKKVASEANRKGKAVVHSIKS